jgi:hypothetical protein
MDPTIAPAVVAKWGRREITLAERREPGGTGRARFSPGMSAWCATAPGRDSLDPNVRDGRRRPSRCQLGPPRRPGRHRSRGGRRACFDRGRGPTCDGASPVAGLAGRCRGHMGRETTGHREALRTAGNRASAAQWACRSRGARSGLRSPPHAPFHRCRRSGDGRPGSSQRRARVDRMEGQAGAGQIVTTLKLSRACLWRVSCSRPLRMTVAVPARSRSASSPARRFFE